jgi:hypothetical protein
MLGFQATEILHPWLTVQGLETFLAAVSHFHALCCHHFILGLYILPEIISPMHCI